MRSCLIVVLLVLSVAVVAAAPPQSANSGSLQLITLRAHDSLTSAWDDRTGGYVQTVSQGELDLSTATLAFSQFEDGMLSFGFRLRERAKLVDVGDFQVKPLILPRDVVPQPPIGVINTLRVDRNNLQYIAPANRVLNLVEGEPVFGRLLGEGIQHVKPELGHTYLLRYAFNGGERIVAFQVVGLIEGQEVTLRTKVLSAS